MTITKRAVHRPPCTLCGHTWAQHQESDSGCWAQLAPGEFCGCSTYVPELIDPDEPDPEPPPTRRGQPVPAPRRVGPYTPPLIQRREIRSRFG